MDQALLQKLADASTPEDVKAILDDSGMIIEPSTEEKAEGEPPEDSPPEEDGPPKKGNPFAKAMGPALSKNFKKFGPKEESDG